MKKSLEITITPEGEVVIEAKGYSGATCEKATAEIERALGRRSKQMKTADYAKAQVKRRAGL